MVTAEVDASLNELVRYIFIDNKQDNIVYMNLPYGESGIRDNHDLFVFFVDLLCKGLVMLYGNEDNKVPIDTLTQQQLAYVTAKLKNAGIDLKVMQKEIVTINRNPILVKPRIYKGDDDTLDSYNLRIVSNNIEYTIAFALLRI